MPSTDYDELKAIATEANRRGDRATAMKAMQKMEALTQAPEPAKPDSSTPWGDTALTMATGALAEPIAGLAGISAALTPGLPAGAGAARVQSVRDALTYRSDAPNSQAALQSTGEALAPVTGFLQRAQKEAGYLGNEVAGPVGGAIGETVPTALMMLVGGGRVRTPALRAGPLPTAAGGVVRAGEAAGVPVLTSDVRPPTTWLGKQAQSLGEKIPMVGTGPVRADQQAARQAAVEGVAAQYGQPSYPDIVASLKAQKDRIKSAAGNVMESAGQKLDRVGPVTFARTRQAIAAARARLSRPEVATTSTKALEDINKIEEALNNPQTFTTLKENRTAYRSMRDGIDPATLQQMPTQTKAIGNAVYHAMTQDMRDFARSNLSPREFSQWERANQVYAEEATLLTRTRLKRIFDVGDQTPESVQGMLFSAKPSEVRLLHDNLTPRGRANARAAIIAKVVENVSKRAGGLAPNQFLNELNKFGNSTEVFFRGADRQQLEGLRRALDATRRAQEAAAAPPTGQSTIPLLTMLGIGMTGVKGAAVTGTLGGLARLYESAPVRDALLNLGAGPARGPTFELRLAKTRAAIAAEAASLGDAGTSEQSPQ